MMRTSAKLATASLTGWFAVQLRETFVRSLEEAFGLDCNQGLHRVEKKMSMSPL